MDFGLNGVLEMFEKRFGRNATTILLAIIALAVASFSLGTIYSYLIKPTYDAIKNLWPSALSIEIGGLTALYIGALLSIIVLLIPAFLHFLGQRRVPQSIVDQLAVLRSEAIHEILNGAVKSDADLDEWKRKEDKWRDDILTVLRSHFQTAEALGFERLGVIPQVGFPFSFNNEHAFRLMMFAKRLSILEDIIRRHTR